MQSDVDSRFSCRIARRKAVNIRKNIVELERIAKLAEIYFAKKRADTLYRLSQILRHRGFTVARYALIGNLYLYVGRGCAGVSGHGEYVAQLQFVGEKAHFQPPRLCFLVDVE